MDNWSLAVTVLLFVFISTGFLVYNNTKFRQIEENKIFVPLMNDQLFPSDFLKDGSSYSIECKEGEIKEDDIITKEKTILYGVSSPLSFSCDNTILNDVQKLEELAEKVEKRCIIKKRELYLCSKR